MEGLVAYKLVAYKKNYYLISIPGFSISRLANVEILFVVDVFFKCKYSFKYFCVVYCCLSFSAMSNLNSADFTTPSSHQRF